VAERNRPGDDAADERPEDESAEIAAQDDDADVEGDEPVGRGGTAVRERTESDDKPKVKKERRNPIGRFFREVVGELRKVIWPTRKELLTYTAVVIVFVTVMTALVGVLDYGFGKGILWAFGN
jgi:preprotein translocase subunit SecE